MAENLYTWTATSTTNFTAYNGDPHQNINVATTSTRIYRSLEERIDYQQQAYIEPRDHEYNPREPKNAIYGVSECMDCHRQNVHRFDADKHLYVVHEEDELLDRLAS